MRWPCTQPRTERIMNSTFSSKVSLSSIDPGGILDPKPAGCRTLGLSNMIIEYVVVLCHNPPVATGEEATLLHPQRSGTTTRMSRCSRKSGP